MPMAIMTIVTAENNILRKKAQSVTDFDASLRELAKNLADTLDAATEPEGAGLAAPQLGAAKKVCVVKQFVDDPANPSAVISNTFFLVNPKITFFSKDKDVMWEGCFSVPNVWGQVERSKKIKVTAQDLDGNEIKIAASGFFARVIQHEVDHLEGVLFVDKAIGKTISGAALDELQRAEEQE